MPRMRLKRATTRQCRRLAIEALENRWLLTGITSISPTSAAQGTTNLTVTFNISTSATPPIPPAGMAPTTVTLGTIQGTSFTHNSQYVVTAVFAIPSNQAIGSYDAGLTFTTPNGTNSYSLTSG